MATPITRSHNPAIREVARGLADARDAQILQVVAMVDAMPDRGAADQILAPLRPKLARLRPPRPLRFARLLFLPLDPLIVPPARWRPDKPSIPRTIIPLFAAAALTALGPAGNTLLAMIDGHTTREQTVVEAAGALVWKDAGTYLLDAPLPPGWDTTGLGPHLHKSLARRIGALLLQAERFQRLGADAAEGIVPPEASLIQTILVEATRCESTVQPMLIALLLARVPESAPVLARVVASLGKQAEASLRTAGDLAADVLLDQLEAPGGAEGHLGGEDLAETAASVRRVSALLGALDGESISFARRERLHGMRERLRGGCEAVFAERLAADLLDPLRMGDFAQDPGAEWEFEAAARGLRALETEARRAGGGKTYDMLLGQAADMVREVTVRGGLGQAGGLRLMEILAGPEVALALFGLED